MNPLQHHHVLILGLGASGLAMARWCSRAGAQVTVADTRAAPPQLAALQRDVPAARFVTEPLDAALLQGGITAVFKSPGLSPAEVAPLAAAAQAMAIPVAGELSLFSQALADLKASRDYTPQVLAITGTNGKTTVTSLTGQLVERAGKTVAVAGNIGPALLDTLMEKLDANALPEVWVLELSSFQLDGVRNFEPTAGAVLNISQDHLDWHGSMQAYVQAKAAVFGEHGLMILNRDDETVMAMLSADRPPLGAKAPLGLTAAAPDLPAQVGTDGRAVASGIGTSSAAHAMASAGATKAAPVRGKLQKPRQRDCVTFGGDMPQRPGDFGIESVNGMAWLVRALEADETIRPRKGEAPELFIQRLMPADALRIRGRHNAINALSALALACAAGCALGPMLYGLRDYRGEPHRVQPVGIIDGIEFFDDSKGTNVGATVAALQGLGAERRVVVILGGEGKGQDFSPLAAPVRRYCRAVVLIGRDAPLLRAALAAAGVPLLDAGSMVDAVAQASAQAQAGDAVLMSPACASFDMFDNYEHRARQFVQAVENLAQDAGVMLEGGL